MMKSRKRKRRWERKPLIGMSAEDMQRTCERMEMYDNLTDEEAALVQEYGFSLGIAAARQFYGQLAKARAWCEAERQRLQSARWENRT